MTINVSEALDSDTAISIQFRRYTGGLYTDGIYQEGTATLMRSLMSPQQPTAAQLQILPENERVSDIMLFISKKRLFTAQQSPVNKADEILYDGFVYKVIQIAKWNQFGHNMAYGVRQPS